MKRAVVLLSEGLVLTQDFYTFCPWKTQWTPSRLPFFISRMRTFVPTSENDLWIKEANEQKCSLQIINYKNCHHKRRRNASLFFETFIRVENIKIRIWRSSLDDRRVDNSSLLTPVKSSNTMGWLTKQFNSS